MIVGIVPISGIDPRLLPVQISAIIITKNEERVLGRCLATLAWCDEILLVDSGSTDRTVDIAREHGARILVESEWKGPSIQRNRGMAAAQYDWCLLLDADEWVTDGLRDEIMALEPTDAEAAYRCPRLSSYCGRFMHHGGWRPDYIVRLVNRRYARYEGGIVHDHCVPSGVVGTLDHSLMHEPYRTLDQVLAKSNAYSSWGAEDMVKSGRNGSLARAILHGFWAFWRTYFIRGGFLDGRHGFMLAVSNAETTYYKYLKAMLLADEGR